MNTENLLKLAAFLRALPPDYDNFNMSVFFEGNLDQYIKTHVCGTPACALGHGIQAGCGPIPQDHNPIIFWPEYCKQAFGFEFSSPLGTLAFGPAWPDCPILAAERIEYLAAHPDLEPTRTLFENFPHDDSYYFHEMMDNTFDD